MKISFLLNNKIVPIIKSQRTNNQNKQKVIEKKLPVLLQKSKWIA
jgi:hypothetical protein